MILARQHSRSSLRALPHNAAFTLIEILLVVAIFLITSAISVPLFVRSFRGAKLRTAGRMVVMSHRYARAMAVLRQTPMAILYDTKLGEIEIVSVQSASDLDRSKFLDNRTAPSGTDLSERTSASIQSELRRKVPEGVRIAKISSRVSLIEKDGLYLAQYYTSGMCDPYTVELHDEDNKVMRITVDPISGKASAEYE